MCLAQEESGKWRNSDPNTRSLRRIELRFVCQDQILNGEPYPPGAPWYIHVFGSCEPTDCDWHEVPADRLTSGYVLGRYKQGYAKRFVYARMSQLYPGQLYVYTWTDFKDEARNDYASTNWFVREAP